MNTDDFRNALFYLGVDLPYGYWPGLQPDGGVVNIAASEAIYEAAGFNPPPGWEAIHPAPDPDASAKPTWSALIEAHAALTAKVPVRLVELGLDALGYAGAAVAFRSLVDVDRARWMLEPWQEEGPKPGWTALVAAGRIGVLASARSDALDRMLDEERARIARAYIDDQGLAPSVEQETLFRLRALETGAALGARHAERDRLHALAVALRAWLEDPTRTLDDLAAFDAGADAHWVSPAG